MPSTNKELGEIRSVMDLTYMKRLRFALHLMGSWPYSAFGIKKSPLPLRNSKFLFIFYLSIWITEIAYVKENMNVLGIFELGHTYITIFMSFITWQRMTLPWMKKYKETTKEFVTKIHLLNFKHKSDYAMKVYLQVDKICSTYVLFLYSQMFFGIVLFNLIPLYINYSHGMFNSNTPVNGTYEVSVYFKLPFDYQHNFNGYLIVFIANWFFSYDVSSVILTFDLYLSIIVFHLWGHLKILKYNLDNFCRPEIKGSIENPPMFTEEESEQVTILLKESINYHKLIKDFITLTSDAFGPSICIYYAFHQVSGCILLLECSKMNTEALARYGLLTLILFQQLIQLSIVFELLGSKSETLKDSVYGIPWECMNTKNRKIVLFYLYNIQEPIKLKALGVVPVGVQTMTAILKTSFSYFMLLRTLECEEHSTDD